MSTNFSFVPNEQNPLKVYGEIHLGKSSTGWSFTVPERFKATRAPQRRTGAKLARCWKGWLQMDSKTAQTQNAKFVILSKK